MRLLVGYAPGLHRLPGSPRDHEEVAVHCAAGAQARQHQNVLRSTIGDNGANGCNGQHFRRWHARYESVKVDVYYRETGDIGVVLLDISREVSQPGDDAPKGSAGGALLGLDGSRRAYDEYAIT